VARRTLTSAKRLRDRCPICKAEIHRPFSRHIREAHGESELRRTVVAAKKQGMPDAEIGARYGVSFNYLQDAVTAECGANISVLTRPKRIRRWEPKAFGEETTTVWSFKQRGDWATHDGRYRGNWSPYIPRNVILKYSKPGETVLDYFVGGGTTAVEAKLLGRRCIARDINPAAVQLTLENLDFARPPESLSGKTLPCYEPVVRVGDARNFSDIPDGSIDLICAHPPYVGIIPYSANGDGDLSLLSLQDFLREMGKVARESLRVLKPTGKCAILIGDARKSKRVVPIGFQTIRVFLDAGFALRELVIKRQHNCKTTGFWYTRSIQHNFLLLSHEYLPIFEKPVAMQVAEPTTLWEYCLPSQPLIRKLRRVEKENLETTTVWIFAEEELEDQIKRNLQARFASTDGYFEEVTFDGVEAQAVGRPDKRVSLLHIRPPKRLADAEAVAAYRASIVNIAEQHMNLLAPGSHFVVETWDVRTGEALCPTALLMHEDLSKQTELVLKEIVVVVPSDSELAENGGSMLNIVHRYLLIYVNK